MMLSMQLDRNIEFCNCQNDPQKFGRGTDSIYRKYFVIFGITLTIRQNTSYNSDKAVALRKYCASRKSLRY